MFCRDRERCGGRVTGKERTELNERTATRRRRQAAAARDAAERRASPQGASLLLRRSRNSRKVSSAGAGQHAFRRAAISSPISSMGMDWSLSE